jgi:hypothetical protein
MKSEFRRGFKKECEEIVFGARADLGQARYAPFDPFAYAKFLGIPCVPVSELARDGCPEESLAHVAGAGRRDFSAVTIREGTTCLIVYNDSNDPERQKSDVAHELAHVLLEHEAGPLFGTGGCRNVDELREKEATWLGGALLVPEHVALSVARRLTVEEAAQHYGVSEELMRWRVNATGALKRAGHERRKAGSR